MFKLKYFLSFLFDVLLEQCTSSYNPVLKLYLSQGQLKLVSANAVYSYGNHYYNFRDCFSILNLGQYNIQSVLILGLGTGSIIQILEQKFNINSHIEAIEIDPVIISIFNRYKNTFTTSQVKIHSDDAYNFLSKNHKIYDLICMDIFNDRTIPELFETTAFLQLMNRALSDQGVLVYNRINCNELDQSHNEIQYNLFKQIFPTASIVKLNFNWMFVVRPEGDSTIMD